MSDPSKAVFLSYASQDAEAAKRICEALRAAGVEVWFDQSELVGGDAWDQKIRKQIKECSLLIPIISAATQARREGYFRIEWKLAAQRTHAFADGTPFLLPVVIDATRDAEALVPEEFRAVQWTRVAGGEASEAFCARVGTLLDGNGTGVPPTSRNKDRDGRITQVARASRPAWSWLALAATVMALGAAALWQPWRHGEGGASPSSATSPVASTARTDAAGRIARVRSILAKTDVVRAQLDTAGGLIDEEIKHDQTSAEAWALRALVDWRYANENLDGSPARLDAARQHARQAVSLDETNGTARLAQALALVLLNDNASAREAAIKMLEPLAQRSDVDVQVLLALGWLERSNLEKAFAYLDRAARVPGAAGQAHFGRAMVYFRERQFQPAVEAIDQALATERATKFLFWKAYLQLMWEGDAGAANRTIAEIPAEFLVEDFAMTARYIAQIFYRDYDGALSTLRAFPRDFIGFGAGGGPTGYLKGFVLARAGRAAAAEIEWRAALEVVERRLRAEPNDGGLLINKALLLTSLGDKAAAEKLWRATGELFGQSTLSWTDHHLRLLLLSEDEALDYLAAEIERADRVWALAGRLRLDPYLDRLRDHPRFAALLARAEADPRLSPRAAKASGVRSSVADAKSVAVLAFANLSDDKANEYFSDGISEELLNVLAKIPGLKVSARTSAFYFKGKEVPIPEIARQLGVAYVVEGSVRKQGDKVRITAQLIKAADGFHVWSETFTRDLKDIFAVQDEIAGLIAKNLSFKLADPGAAPTTSVKAFELMLQARERLRQNLSLSGRDRVVQLLQDAVAEDPQFLQARIGLVDVFTRGGGSLSGRTMARESDAGRQLPAARRELEEAQRIAPNDPWVAFAEALYYYQGDQTFPTALKHIARARALLPREPEFLRLEARILRRLGRIDEALPKWAEALQLDPLNVAIWRESGESFQLQRRYPEAANATAHLAVLEPGRHWMLNEIVFRHLATADAAVRDEFERVWGNLDVREPVWRPFDGLSLNHLLPQWKGDRAELVRQATILGARPVMNQAELPSPIGSEIGIEAGRATWTMLALAGAGERDAARTLAAAHVKAYGGLLAPGTENVSGQVGQWYCMAATWHFLEGDETRARAQLAQMKELDRQETDAFWRAYRLAWLLPVWSHLEPAEAAAKFLRELDEPMSFLSLDEIATNPWVYRPLLLDARVRARLVQQGKWLAFLADRVPEYAEFKTKR